MDTTEMIDIMFAHSVGKEIEYKHKSTHGWEECKLPLWNWTNFEYRVKKADKYREQQIVKLFNVFSGAYNEAHKAGTLLYDAGCRVLADDERIVKPLSSDQVHRLRCLHAARDLTYVNIIDAVQRELKVID